MQDSLTAFAALAIVPAAAVFSATLIVALGPWLARYAMAKPNARSSHKMPTPQGGGIAVIGATILVSGGVLFFSSTATASVLPLVVILAAVLLIAAVGVMADKRPIAAAPRLVLQSFAVVAVLATLPPELRLLPVLPWWSERILLLIGALWFVNLVNFMDGLDWMTVVEVVPITAALAAHRLAWLPSMAGYSHQPGAVRRDDWFCFFQPAGRKTFSRRRRQSSDRPAAWLAACLCLRAAAGTPPRCCCRCIILADSTITLLRRAVNRRTGLAGAPVAFLSARH